MNNRIHNSSNPYQGQSKRVLTVCSAGLLRSPTAAWVLSNEPFNYNTRSAGIETSYALIPVDEVLLRWADEIVCMNPRHAAAIRRQFPDVPLPPIVELNIEDNYAYRDKKLVQLIVDQYKAKL